MKLKSDSHKNSLFSIVFPLFSHLFDMKVVMTSWESKKRHLQPGQMIKQIEEKVLSSS